MTNSEAAQEYCRAMKSGDAAEAARCLAMLQPRKNFESELDAALYRRFGLEPEKH